MNCIQAKEMIPIPTLLAAMGLRPVRQDRSGLFYRSPFSPKGDQNPSLQVSLDGRAFNDWSSGKRGTVIDLVIAITGNPSVRAALRTLYEISNANGVVCPRLPATVQEPYNRVTVPGIVVTDVSPIRSRLLLGYLWYQRGIHSDLACEHCREVSYYLRNCPEKHYFAIGFRNNSGGWELRNARVKQATAPKDITTVNDMTGCPFYVFEGFIDLLTAIQLDLFATDSANAIVLNSTAMTQRAITAMKSYEPTEIICMLDADVAGRNATTDITGAFPDAKDFSFFYQQKGFNDLNDLLMGRINDS